MASSTTAIEAFSKATGIPHVTMGHTARLLRQARDELWPRSGKGGGKSASHVEEWHLANLILSFGGAQPSDAPKAAAKLGMALYAGVEPSAPIASTHVLYALSKPALDKLRDEALKQYEVNLQETLVLLIRRVATAKAIGNKNLKLLDSARQNWELWLNSNFNIAWTSVTDEKDINHHEYYELSDSTFPKLLTRRVPPALVERLVKIPFSLIEVAADLWTDTLAQRGYELPLATTRAAGGTAARRSESAGGADTPPAPTRNRPGSRQSPAGDQPSFRQTGGRTAPPKPKAGERETQARALTVGRSSRHKGDRR